VIQGCLRGIEFVIERQTFSILLLLECLILCLERCWKNTSVFFGNDRYWTSGRIVFALIFWRAGDDIFFPAVGRTGLGIEIGDETRVVGLVGTGEFDSWGTCSSSSADLYVKAVRIGLRPRFSCVVKRYKFCSQDVGSWLNITRKLERVSAVRFNKLLISP
jgi:hypothetical protein